MRRRSSFSPCFFRCLPSGFRADLPGAGRFPGGNLLQNVPEPALLDVTPDMQQDIGRILRHSYRAQQLRYWRDADRTVWILEEIGRYRPITVGLVVSRGDRDHPCTDLSREPRLGSAP